MKNLLSQVVSRNESATKLAAWIERAQAIGIDQAVVDLAEPEKTDRGGLAAVQPRSRL